MKSRTLVLAAVILVLVIGFGSWRMMSQRETPPPTLADPGPFEPARGVVFDDENGNGIRDPGEPGIPGVGVSDQEAVTVTDAEGRWILRGGEKKVYFVIKPRGYMTPVSEDNLPLFYYLHNEREPLELEGPVIPQTGPLPASLDFPLIRRPEPDRFEVVVMGDPQPRDIQEVNYFTHDVLEELAGTSAAFAITLGDITFDRLGLYPAIVQAEGRVGIPFYNTHGNHDANYDGADTYDHYETWRTVFGPRYYSFDYGPVHFVILSNVLFPQGGTSYVPGLGPEQLAWLEADLSLVPKDRPIVLAMHIPPQGADTNEDFGRLEELLLDRPHVLSFSAHSHVINMGFLDERLGWSGESPHFHINAGAACGRWWGGAPDETDIPHATGSDGSPNGYFIASFSESDYSVRFKAARRPADYQMQIQAPSEVAQARLAETPVLVNVFAGSDRSVVEMAVDDSQEWIPLEYAPQPDPLYARVTERESGQRAGVSTHMWEGRLPSDLPVGGHLIRVRTTDLYGQSFTDARILRVTEEVPAPQAQGNRPGGLR